MTEEHYRTFWDWFKENEDELFYFENNEEELLPLTLERIQSVHPEMVFEIGPEIEGVREFVISANGMKKAFPEVIELAKAAPELDRWEIIPFRQRKDAEDIEVQIDDIVVTPDDIFFSFSKTKDKVDLEIFAEGFADDDERMYHLVFLLLDNVVGEYDVEMKIGSIDISALTEANDTSILLRLTELPDVIDGLHSYSVH